MSTILFPSPIFGPVHSRRLGVSLGINLLPSDGKLCSFDCIYCECGFNEDRHGSGALPSREEVRTELEKKLREMSKNGPLPDVITFAGNGEPTLHPDFPLIVDDVIALRDGYCPEAEISVLSNATMADKKPVKEALLKIENNILKLDTTDTEYIHAVDRPVGRYRVERIIETLCGYEGRVIIQTIFMKGRYQNRSVDNTSERFVAPWLEALKRIRPKQVMIYTIDRETPAKGLLKASPEELDAIAEQVARLGIKVSASY